MRLQALADILLQIYSRIGIRVATNDSNTTIDIGINLNRLGKETICFNIRAGLQVQIVAFADALQSNKKCF